jgi:dTDP-glucose 4,6-dehydratase
VCSWYDFAQAIGEEAEALGLVSARGAGQADSSRITRRRQPGRPTACSTRPQLADLELTPALARGPARVLQKLQGEQRWLTLAGDRGRRFIGANFVHYWLREHPEDRVIGLRCADLCRQPRQPGRGLDSNPRLSFVHADICDEERVTTWLLRRRGREYAGALCRREPRGSLHQRSGCLYRDQCDRHPQPAQGGAQVWLDGDGRPHRFHHVSTDEVYGSLAPAIRDSTRRSSTSRTRPTRRARPPRITWCAPTTTPTACRYPPATAPTTTGPSLPEKLIPLCITNILRGLELPVYGDGSNIRDWLYVEDHCAASSGF